MYKAEVLSKLPIMQHFLFGSLIPFVGSAGDCAGHEDVSHDHVHLFGQEHPACCSIRVPSRIAAVAAEGHKVERMIPFD
jgi:serine/threonine-protein phosphatase 2A activator